MNTQQEAVPGDDADVFTRAFVRNVVLPWWTASLLFTARIRRHSVPGRYTSTNFRRGH